MKQKYHIYHATGDDKFKPIPIQPRIHVGIVETDSLQNAFLNSQNFRDYWNPTNPCRSTSVGDVIQDSEGLHMICGTGFKLLEDFNPKPFSMSPVDDEPEPMENDVNDNFDENIYYE